MVKRDALSKKRVILIYAVAILASLLLSAVICALFSGKSPFKFFGSLFFGALGTSRGIWLLLQDTALLLGVAVALIAISTADDSDALTDDSYEARVADICNSIEGVGRCRVLIYYGEPSTRYSEKKVEGIVVVCEGAGSVEVRRRLTEALSSFFGIGSNRVIIEKMQK